MGEAQIPMELVVEMPTTPEAGEVVMEEKVAMAEISGKLPKIYPKMWAGKVD